MAHPAKIFLTRWGKRALLAASLAAGVLLALYLALRYEYHYLPGGSRAVELNYGRFKLDLPWRWQLYERHGNEYRLQDSRLPSALILLASYRESAPTAEERQKLLDPGATHAAFRQIQKNRFYRRFTASRKFNDEPFPVIRHELIIFDPKGPTWYLQADLLQIPGTTWLPTPAADTEFFDKAIPNIQVSVKSKVDEDDEWATARVELGKADDQLHSAVTVVTWATVGFFLTWLIAYLVCERLLRISKVGYTYISQATTLISAIGIFLAGIALFTSKTDYRMQIAEVAADSELDKALTYYGQAAETCTRLSKNGDWSLTVTPSPAIPTEMGASFSCERLLPYLNAMVSHLLDAREHLLKSGDFTDPDYRLGLPISLFIGNAHQLAFRVPDLTNSELNALSERCDYYFGSIDSVLRLVQSQQNVIDLSAGLTGVSKLWSVVLAIALALNMVKLSSDRRFEREKDAESTAKKAAEQPAKASTEEGGTGVNGSAQVPQVDAVTSTATTGQPPPESSEIPAS